MTDLYRIAVIGSKPRRYISGTPENIEISDRGRALHWDKRVAKILATAFNGEFESKGLTQRFQIEKA